MTTWEITIRNIVLLAGALVLTLGGFVAAESLAPDAEVIKPLNEIPLAQLRVMLKGYSGDWRNDSPQAQGVAAPSATKEVAPNVKRIKLPAFKDSLQGTPPLVEVLEHRRSRREYSDEPLTLRELSFLLWSTQGVTGSEDGSVPLRAAPSGGGRYPMETYLAVMSVESTPPGIYRYLPQEHALVVARSGDDPAPAVRTACYDASFVGDAAVVFVWAAVPERTEWKYGYLAHRMIAMEAGHICQNLYLACESIGAATCALLAYDQESMDRLIGVGGKEEFVVYLATVGKRVGE